MGGTSSTQTSTTTPWEPTQDAFKQNIAQTQNLVTNNQGYNAAPLDYLSTPDSWWTTQGLTQKGQVAGQGDPLGQNAYWQNNWLAQNGGLQSWQQPALGSMQAIATGANAINTGGLYNQLLQAESAPRPAYSNVGDIAAGQNGIDATGAYNLYGQIQGTPGANQSYLSDTASGKYLDPANDPYFSKALDIQAGKTADAANRSFSNMGRYGSDVHEAGVTKAVGDVRTNALLNQFARNQGLQQQAAGQISQEQLARTGQQAGLLGQIMGAQGQNIGNRLGAAGLLSNEQQNAFQGQQGVLDAMTQMQGANIANQAGAAQGVQNTAGQTAGILGQLGSQAGNLYNNLANPANMAMDIGKQQESRDAAHRQALLDQFNQTQQAPWQRLAAANSIYGLNGTLGNFGTKTATVPGNANGTGGLLGSLFGLFGL